MPRWRGSITCYASDLVLLADEVATNEWNECSGVDEVKETVYNCCMKLKDVRWQIGKHRGQLLRDLPDSYLRFVCATQQKTRHHKLAMGELAHRRRRLRISVEHKRNHRHTQNRHLQHQAEIRPCKSGPHRYELWCLECDQHIQWVSSRSVVNEQS